MTTRLFAAYCETRYMATENQDLTLDLRVEQKSLIAEWNNNFYTYSTNIFPTRLRVLWVHKHGNQ